MNTPTLIASCVFAALLAVMIAVAIRRMIRGWRRRGDRQSELIGGLPSTPGELGPVTIAPIRGLYVGSTLADQWLERVAVGDLGYRTKAVLTRYSEGILMDRMGAQPIWIPHDAVSAIRTDWALAGKVIPVGGRGKDARPQGILAIRWRLPSGTEIDTGFRSDDRREYARWMGDVA